ncbi:hypothetical protein [Aurantimonas sp. A2-1-M11]|uniref:hypothetical protein n=1 Tax=Aurantimonas sp. A2-1-M11 TaxID=3113712 RepID=UPI002F95E2F5
MQDEMHGEAADERQTEEPHLAKGLAGRCRVEDDAGACGHGEAAGRHHPAGSLHGQGWDRFCGGRRQCGSTLVGHVLPFGFAATPDPALIPSQTASVMRGAARRRLARVAV